MSEGVEVKGTKSQLFAACQAAAAHREIKKKYEVLQDAV